MLCNLHTHTTFCDGKSTAEEIVLTALEKGFASIGFSGHGYTSFDHSYCITDVEGYISEISALKEKYKKDIEVYLGLEEDCYHLNDRSRYDYIIGSCHYFDVNGKLYAADYNLETTKKCTELPNSNVIKLADDYYRHFTEYILKRKPDIIGHFDLITKFDESSEPLFLNSKEYCELAKKYITEAAKSGSLFEVNTGAISRGYRKTPYPSTELLHTLKKLSANVIITSDSHYRDTIDFGFDEAEKLLVDCGFEYTYVLYNGEFIKDYLK